MTILSCSNLSKSFITKEIFSDVSFNIEEKDRVGLVGANGAGKTTLFNILTGEIEADSGTVFIPKGVSLGYQHQQLDLEEEGTVYESLLSVFSDVIEMGKELERLTQDMANVEGRDLEEKMDRYQRLLDLYEEKNGYGYESSIRGMIKGLGFEEYRDMPVKNLSGGQKSRLELSKLLLRKPDILFLDEPTNHLDMDSIAYLENFLLSYEGTIFVISHDRYFLDKTVKRIFYMENKRLKVYNTDYSHFAKRRKEDRENSLRAYENQQREIKREEEIIERYGNTGKKNLNIQAKSRKKRLDKLERLEKPDSPTSKISLRFTPEIESGNDVLSVEDLSMAYSGEEIFKNLSFDLKKGEKVVLIGPNGIGKTSLFKVILGDLREKSGEIRIGANVFFGYYDQEHMGLHGEKTVIDEVWDDYPNLKYQEIRGHLARFLFYGDSLDRRVFELSGGEKGRLSLLKIMLGKSNTLLMDEPTNHLDIDSKEILEDALLSYDGTLLIISHDRYFINKLADRLLVMSKDGMENYLGNYDYYRLKLEEAQEKDEEAPSTTKTQEKKLKKKMKNSEQKIREKKRRLKKLEEEIGDLEEEISTLEEKSYLPEVYQDPEESQALFNKIGDLKEKKEDLENDWFLLSEEMEGIDG